MIDIPVHAARYINSILLQLISTDEFMMNIPIALPVDFMPLERQLLSRWSFEVLLPFDMVTALRHKVLAYLLKYDDIQKFESAVRITMKPP